MWWTVQELILVVMIRCLSSHFQQQHTTYLEDLGGLQDKEAFLQQRGSREGSTCGNAEGRADKHGGRLRDGNPPAGVNLVDHLREVPGGPQHPLSHPD